MLDLIGPDQALDLSARTVLKKHGTTTSTGYFNQMPEAQTTVEVPGEGGRADEGPAGKLLGGGTDPWQVRGLTLTPPGHSRPR